MGKITKRSAPKSDEEPLAKKQCTESTPPSSPLIIEEVTSFDPRTNIAVYCYKAGLSSLSQLVPEAVDPVSGLVCAYFIGCAINTTNRIPRTKSTTQIRDTIRKSLQDDLRGDQRSWNFHEIFHTMLLHLVAYRVSPIFGKDTIHRDIRELPTLVAVAKAGIRYSLDYTEDTPKVMAGPTHDTIGSATIPQLLYMCTVGPVVFGNAEYHPHFSLVSILTRVSDWFSTHGISVFDETFIVDTLMWVVCNKNRLAMCQFIHAGAWDAAPCKKDESDGEMYPTMGPICSYRSKYDMEIRQDIVEAIGCNLSRYIETYKDDMIANFIMLRGLPGYVFQCTR